MTPNALIQQGAKIVPGGAAVLGPAIAAGALVATVGKLGMAKIPQEHVGLRVHNGRLRAVKDEKIFSRKKSGELYGLVRAGLRFSLPGPHKFEIIDTQNHNANLTNFMAMSTQKRQHEIDAVLTWGVVKEFDEKGLPIPYDIPYPELVFKALMAAKNMEEMSQGISGICTEGLRHILQQRERPDYVKGSDVQQELVSMCGEELLMTYGTEIRRLSINGASYSAADYLVNGRVQTEDGVSVSQIPAPRSPSDQLDLSHIGAVFPNMAPGLNLAG